MSPQYTILLRRNNDYNLEVVYSPEFKTMSEDDAAVAIEDCINTLKTELLLIQQS
jgi:hypothetical protein